MGLSSKDKVNSRSKMETASLPLRVAYFSYYFSIGCIQPFQSIILKAAGLTISQVGTVGTIGLVGGIISPITIGFLADKTKKSRILLIFTSALNFIFHGAPIIIIFFVSGIGNSKGVARASTGQSITTFPSDKAVQRGASLNATLPSFYVLLSLCVVQFFATFCDQGSKALMDGIVHKIITESEVQSALAIFARLRMFGSLGSCFSSLIFGILLDYIRMILPPSFPPELCLVVLCFAMGAVYVFNVVLFMPDAETKVHVELSSAIKSVVKDTKVLVFLLVAFMCYSGFSVTRSYEGLYILHLGGSKFLSGITQALSYITDVVSMYFSPVICRKLGRAEYTLILTFVVNSLRAVMFGLADSFFLALNNSLLTGFCIGLYFPTISVLVKGQAPVHLISSYVSLLTTIGKVGAAISNKLGGDMAEYFGYRTIQFISAGLFALNAVILASYMYFVKLMSEKDKRGSGKVGDKDGEVEKSLIIINEEINQKV